MSKSINKIVIGDVGSGKTITAFLIALTYLKGLKNKGQIAMMAPTDVLAYQHYQSLCELQKNNQENFKKFGFEFLAIYISGKNLLINQEKFTPKKLEKYIQENLDKKIFWIGTHALLFKDFIQPDLVMIDEQHRFGVNQRQELSQKYLGQTLHPHFISFTATPIPRTLALTLYGNLQPHFLQALQGRTKIETFIRDIENLQSQIFDVIQEHLQKNRKVFIICPKIEESEKEDEELFSVAQVYKTMQEKFGDQVLQVHGKVAEKKDILQDFKDFKNKNILVSTTVIEVGVDVKEASLMIIFNAERFGLSALHQIRGRVGRNSYTDNQCVLLTYKKYMKIPRLSYLVKLQDGFELAEKDLQLRGAGDFLGSSQSGFGDEIDEIMGLDSQLYEEIYNQVQNLETDSLPRLKNFLNQQKNKVWGE